ncbi:HmuY family protein [candidate division KSB1 bacterium]|nr:HmuY family protein [candidate division KSB1 bacterium]
MKKLFLTAFITTAVISGCSEDKNPTKPADTSGHTYLTSNIKIEPSFYSLGKLGPVQTFDVVFHIVNRSPDLGLNSGSNGSAGVSAKDLGPVDLNEAADVSGGFYPDAGDTTVIGDSWYIYDFVTHTVSSKNNIYLIRGADNQVYKLRVDAYTQNTWTITFSPVDDQGVPTNIQSLEISATEETPAYFSFSQGKVITPEAWDIAFTTIRLFIEEMAAFIQNPAARINGVAGAQVAEISGVTFENLSAVPGTAEFKTDSDKKLALGDTIFDYNPQTHKLSTPDVVYVIQSTGGKFYKLKITSYYHPQTGESGFVNFKAEEL